MADSIKKMNKPIIQFVGCTKMLSKYVARQNNAGFILTVKD